MRDGSSSIGSSTVTRICPTRSTDGKSSPHRDLRANSSGTWDSYAFSDPPIRSESDPADQRKRLGYKLTLLESSLQDQETRAANQAKEGA